MASIKQEILGKLSNIQSQIWQTASMTVSEAANYAINFAATSTESVGTSALYAELNSPMLVIQFAFANLPENSQVVILSEETFAEIAGVIKNETVREIDDALVAETKPVFESLVHGLCLAVGNIKNDAVAASGMMIRYQPFVFPPNMQKPDDVLKSDLSITIDDFTGTGMWLIDAETAYAVLGLTMDEDTPAAPFTPVDTGTSATTPTSFGSAPMPTAIPGSENSLEMLKDIPLDISVELGRVKMLVREVIELGTGSIVEIEKAAGEPVDILVNGRLVAKGEVVVIEDNFGVRVTEILTPQERLNKLGEVA